jgi:hypothetical protein
MLMILKKLNGLYLVISSFLLFSFYQTGWQTRFSMIHAISASLPAVVKFSFDHGQPIFFWSDVTRFQ